MHKFYNASERTEHDRAKRGASRTALAAHRSIAHRSLYAALRIVLLALAGLALYATPAAAQKPVFSQDGRNGVPSIQRTDGSASIP